MAGRQLKRTLTVMELDDLGGRAASSASSHLAVNAPVPDIEMALSDALPVPRALPPQLPILGRKDYGSMNPPRQPPSKRPTFELEAAAQVAAMPTPQTLFASPPRMRPAMSPPPQRALTPRVSWSELKSLGRKESFDELPPSQPSQGSPPRTPVVRMRQVATPPESERRVSARRRPPSNERESPDHDQNEGRLHREFCGIKAIGKGQFSTVYKVQNRIDECLYAVKKTTQISRGLRRTQLREVFALANISMEAEGCPNVVRYYSSWLEDGRLHIQTELCECSLRERMAQKKSKFFEAEIVPVVRDVANGLKVLHGCDFVHLDIKPDNILVSRNKDGCYKIADLGLAAAAMGSGCDDISEGDCRYLAKEVLRGNLAELPKADVFALGLVSYELASYPKPLPPNGDEWQLIREGCLDLDMLAHLSEPLVELMRSMAAALPADRPPCEEILRHSSIAPDGDMQESSKEQELQRRLEDSEAAVKAAAEQAERSRELANAYYHEILQMKKQELLAPAPPANVAKCLRSGSGSVTSAKAAAATGAAAAAAGPGGLHGRVAAAAAPLRDGAARTRLGNPPHAPELRRLQTS